MCTLRPGSTPLENLASALAAQGLCSGDLDDVRRELRNSRFGLVRIVQQGGLAEDENLLVFVDQFEELFRFQEPRDVMESEEFVQTLLAAVNSFPDELVYIVLTMRSDFLGECARFRELAEALNRSQYLIPRPTRKQLQEVIEKPLHEKGVGVSQALTHTILNELSDDPDQLALLQHTLNRTFHEYRKDNSGRWNSSITIPPEGWLTLSNDTRNRSSLP